MARDVAAAGADAAAVVGAAAIAAAGSAVEAWGSASSRCKLGSVMPFSSRHVVALAGMEAGTAVVRGCCEPLHHDKDAPSLVVAADREPVVARPRCRSPASMTFVAVAHTRNAAGSCVYGARPKQPRRNLLLLLHGNFGVLAFAFVVWTVMGTHQQDATLNIPVPRTRLVHRQGPAESQSRNDVAWRVRGWGGCFVKRACGLCRHWTTRGCVGVTITLPA